MANQGIVLKLASFDKLMDELSGAKLDKKISESLGKVATYINSELESQIIQNYRVKNNLSSVFSAGRGSSNVSKGKTFINYGLFWKQKSVPLSRYFENRFWGNLDVPKDRQGWVHQTQIARGKITKSYGKQNYGGFRPTSKDGKVKLYGQAGTYMFERTSRYKYPLRLLYGPSLADFVSYELRKNSFNRIEEKAIQFFIDEMFL